MRGLLDDYFDRLQQELDSRLTRLHASLCKHMTTKSGLIAKAWKKVVLELQPSSSPRADAETTQPLQDLQASVQQWQRQTQEFLRSAENLHAGTLGTDLTQGATPQRRSQPSRAEAPPQRAEASHPAPALALEVHGGKYQHRALRQVVVRAPASSCTQVWQEGTELGGLPSLQDMRAFLKEARCQEYPRRPRKSELHPPPLTNGLLAAIARQYAKVRTPWPVCCCNATLRRRRQSTF